MQAQKIAELKSQLEQLGRDLLARHRAGEEITGRSYRAAERKYTRLLAEYERIASLPRPLFSI